MRPDVHERGLRLPASDDQKKKGIERGLREREHAVLSFSWAWHAVVVPLINIEKRQRKKEEEDHSTH